jgi:hypothetical protein
MCNVGAANCSSIPQARICGRLGSHSAFRIACHFKCGGLVVCAMHANHSTGQRYVAFFPVLSLMCGCALYEYKSACTMRVCKRSMSYLQKLPLHLWKLNWLIDVQISGKRHAVLDILLRSALKGRVSLNGHSVLGHKVVRARPSSRKVRYLHNLSILAIVGWRLLST